MPRGRRESDGKRRAGFSRTPAQARARAIRSSHSTTLMQNEQNAQAPTSTPPWIRSSRARSLLAGVVCLTAVAYTAGVVFGIISQEHRIDATNLIILGLAALIALLLVKP